MQHEPTNENLYYINIGRLPPWCTEYPSDPKLFHMQAQTRVLALTLLRVTLANLCLNPTGNGLSRLIPADEDELIPCWRPLHGLCGLQGVTSSI